MPCPEECPMCGAERGEEWEHLPRHLREDCEGTPEPKDENRWETAGD